MSSTFPVSCPSCGLSGQVSSERAGTEANCTRCKTRFVLQPTLAFVEPESSSQTSPQLYCPVCGHEALDPAGNDLGMSSCGRCEGDWIPPDSAARLIEGHLGLDRKMLPELESFTRADPIGCPSCDSPLTLLKLKGVSVDWCRSCDGLWLDSGELHRLSSGTWGRPRAEPKPMDRLPETAQMALQSLNELRRCRVQQSTTGSLSTVLLGWDHANWYDVRSGMGTVAIIAEERRGWIDDLIRNFTTHQARKLYLLDKYSKNILLEMSRSWFIFTSSLEIRLGQGGPKIGHVQRSLNPIFKEYEIRGVDGQPFARINAPVWRFWTFFIRDVDGGPPIGSIRKKWTGWRKEMYTRADNFDIDFGERSWTLEQRCTLLAAAIAIDLDRFEQR